MGALCGPLQAMACKQGTDTSEATTRTMNLTSETAAKAKTLAQQPTIAGPNNGYGSGPDWKAYLELKRIATEPELERLLSHPSPMVRSYAAYHRIMETAEELTPLLVLAADPARMAPGSSATPSTVSGWVLTWASRARLRDEHDAGHGAPGALARYERFFRAVVSAPGVATEDRELAQRVLNDLQGNPTPVGR